MFAHGVVLSCSCSWFCNHNRLPFLVSVIKKDFVWCGSRFAELQPFRCHHDSSLMVWFSHGVVPGGGHVDVIMNVRSWCGSLMFVFVVL